MEQRPLWDRVEKLQPRPGSGSSSGSSNSSSQASPGDRFRPRCESPGTVLEDISLTLYNNFFTTTDNINTLVDLLNIMCLTLRNAASNHYILKILGYFCDIVHFYTGA